MKKKLLVVDLFCGLGGFGQAFKDRGHRVIGIDVIAPAEMIGDVRYLPLRQDIRPDIVLAAPPCTEFSREDQPWTRTGKAPSMELVDATHRAVKILDPKWWIMENVRGAKRFFTTFSSLKVGSRYFWGRFPMFLCNAKEDRQKYDLSPSPDRWRIRSKIHYEISLALCLSVENAEKIRGRSKVRA